MKVVFVHGFTQTAASWSLPRSSWPRRPPSVLAALDVPDDLEFVATASAIGDLGGVATYVGYSMGGRLCLQLALDRPELVERLVLVSASPGIADGAERATRRAADEELARSIERDGVDAFLDRWIAQPLFASLPRERAGIDDRRTGNTVERLTHQLRELGQGAQPSNWARLGDLATPTLCIAGSRDEKYARIADAMALRCAADVAVLDDRGHACHLEDPLGFVAIVGSWLGSA